MTIIQKLSDNENFTEREGIIAKYILDNCEKVQKLSSRELARQTYTSSTAIIRFCRKLGYDSYNDFKINLVSDMKLSQGSVNSHIDKDDNSILVINKIADIQQSTINETKRLISPEQIERISKKISETRYIDIISIDANRCIGQYACHNFFIGGKIANNYDCTDQLLLLSLNIPEDHVVFLISRSGEHERVVDAAKVLRRTNAYTIAITHDKESSLAKVCDETILALFNENLEDFRDMIFYTSIKYIFDILYSLTFMNSYEEVMKLNEQYSSIYLKKE